MNKGTGWWFSPFVDLC